MNLSSQELSTLTLLASEVPADQVRAELGPDAALVREFLLNPGRIASTDDEKKASITAQQMKEWFQNQKEASRKRAPATRADEDWERLLAL